MSVIRSKVCSYPTSVRYITPDMQVCVVEMADADWNMLPRQAQSISSDQVQMQQQQSMLVGSSFVDATACDKHITHMCRH